MLCKILKSFPYSHDGITAEIAEKGKEADIPDCLVAGLEKEAYVTKAMSVLERQAFTAAPENKAADLSDVREEYQRVMGKKPYHGWDIAELRSKMAEAEK